MTALPPALRRWGPELDGVVPELAVALGPLIARLDRLLGPMQRTRPDPGGDPDGWDDLDRRGPYNRLLLTEWGLLDVDPDEFTRRAFEGEHRFHRLLRVAPIHRRRAVAVFDTGPSQLGGPRVVQLAAAVVLARRARVAGLTLHVARLGDDGPARPWAGVDTLGWLARTPTGVAGDVTQRLAEVGPLGPDDDAWVIAGPGTKAPVSVLTLDDVDEPGAAAIRAESRPRRGLASRLVLDRPDPSLEVRLLRDPGAAWGPKPAAPRRSAKGSPEAPQGRVAGFTPDGQRLLIVDDAAMYALPIPNAPGDGLGKATVRHLDGAVAVIWRKKELIPVHVRGDRLAARGLKLDVDQPLTSEQREALNQRTGDPLLGIVVELNGAQGVVLAPLSGAGPVLVLAPAQRLVRAWAALATVAAVWRHRTGGAGAAWVVGGRTRLVTSGLMVDRASLGTPTAIGWPGPIERSKGSLALVAGPDGAVALRGSGAIWPPLAEQTGPYMGPTPLLGGEVLLPDRGETAIVAHRHATGESRTLVTGLAPVRQIFTTPARGIFAWQDTSGAYGVVTHEGHELLRVTATTTPGRS